MRPSDRTARALLTFLALLTKYRKISPDQFSWTHFGLAFYCWFDRANPTNFLTCCSSLVRSQLLKEVHAPNNLQVCAQATRVPTRVKDGVTSYMNTELAKEGAHRKPL